MNLSQLKPRICGIYKFYNVKTQKVYIGKSVNIEERWHEHVRDFLIGKHQNKSMLNDFQLYGLESFEATILEECEKDLLAERETYWALKENKNSLYNNTNSLFGYKNSE